MPSLTKRLYRRARGFVLICVAAGAGCSSNAPLTHERLDSVTGVTVRYIEHPLVFVRRVPGLDVLAKDFVDLAPIEINRSGDYRYFIWLGVSTAGDDAEIRVEFESVDIFADGTTL